MRSLFAKLLIAMMMLSVTILFIQVAINYGNQIVIINRWHERIVDEYQKKFEEQLHLAGKFQNNIESFSLQVLLEKAATDGRIQSAEIKTSEGDIIASVIYSDDTQPDREESPDRHELRPKAVTYKVSEKRESSFAVILDDVELGTLTLFTLGPTKYSVTRDFFRSSVTVFLISLPASLFLAFILAFFLSRKISSIPVKLSKQLSLLTQGKRDIIFTSSSIRELNLISETAASLQAELLHSQQNRTEFMLNLGHDLKSPLTAMNVLVEGLVDGVFPPENAIFERLQTQLRNLQQKSDDFLLISKLDAAEVTLTQDYYNIVPIINSLMGKYSESITARKLQIITEISEDQIEPVVEADKKLLELALEHIIRNIVDYAELSSTAKISVITEKRQVRIVFENKGDIGTQSPDQLFDHLTKGNWSRSTPGSGLGLTIAKRIISWHSGSITIASNSSDTITVAVTLPLASNEKYIHNLQLEDGNSPS
jgi:two-component system, OmpR family, sensor histidine kinase BaeS